MLTSMYKNWVLTYSCPLLYKVSLHIKKSKSPHKPVVLKLKKAAFFLELLPQVYYSVRAVAC